MAIVGAGYLLAFVATPKLLHRDPPSKQIADLRSALSQIYIDGNNIAGFRQQDAAAYVTLNDLISQFKEDSSQLQRAAKAAQHSLSDQQRAQINTIQKSQQQTADNLQAQYQLLAAPLRYDPADDFAGLSRQELTQHAAAARQGLQKILTNAQLGADATSSVSNMRKCLYRITVASEAEAKHAATNCTREYPALRSKLTHSIIDQGLSTSYRSYIQAHMPALLKALATQ